MVLKVPLVGNACYRARALLPNVVAAGVAASWSTFAFIVAVPSLVDHSYAATKAIARESFSTMSSPQVLQPA